MRSTITPKLVNEARFGMMTGSFIYNTRITSADFNGPYANQGGFALNLSDAGITNPTYATTLDTHNAPTFQWSDNATWMKGTHSVSFGGEFSHIQYWVKNNVVVPSISFGVDNTYDPAASMFSAANRAANIPGATSTDASRAASLYGLFTGRVTAVSGNAYLTPAGKYEYLGVYQNKERMRQMGYFVQDSWRAKPNLTLTAGLRWEVQLAAVGLDQSYSQITLEDVWGISGVHNLYKPGVMTGQPTTYEAYKEKSPLFHNIWNGVGPHLGFAWTPKVDGLLGKLSGGSGTVLRGGATMSFTRHGMDVFNNLLKNPDKRGNPWIKSQGAKTMYDAMVVEFRRRFSDGLLVAANYAWSRSYQMVSYSYRASMSETPSTYTTPHRLKINWLYELPFGKDKKVQLGPKLDRVFGGWQFSGMARLQSGNPILISGVRLVGMTQKDLQDAVGMRFDDAKAVAYWLPLDIINNSIAAFNTDVTQPTGYSSTYGVPTGRYIAPATSDKCVEIYTGQKCSTGGFVITGIPFARWDLSLIKRARITERVEFELRAEFLNAFNSINFQANGRYGGQTNMGQVTASYRDVSTTNDPGGRICQFVGRINF